MLFHVICMPPAKKQEWNVLGLGFAFALNHIHRGERTGSVPRGEERLRNVQNAKHLWRVHTGSVGACLAQDGQ